ncbi:hypothetical protein PF70_06190, partial [Pseudomonas asplenii]
MTPMKKGLSAVALKPLGVATIRWISGARHAPL